MKKNLYEQEFVNMSPELELLTVPQEDEEKTLNAIKYISFEMEKVLTEILIKGIYASSR